MNKGADPANHADDRSQGTITIIFQEVGYILRLLGTLEAGASLADFVVGPLGQVTEIKNATDGLSA